MAVQTKLVYYKSLQTIEQQSQKDKHLIQSQRRGDYGGARPHGYDYDGFSDESMDVLTRNSTSKAKHQSGLNGTTTDNNSRGYKEKLKLTLKKN